MEDIIKEIDEIRFYLNKEGYYNCQNKLLAIMDKLKNNSNQVQAVVMQKIAKGILDDLINEFTPTECVAAHVFYDRLKTSVSEIIDEELEKLKNIEFTNKQTFDSLTNFAEQLKKRF